MHHSPDSPASLGRIPLLSDQAPTFARSAFKGHEEVQYLILAKVERDIPGTPLARRSPIFAKSLVSARFATTQSDALYVPGGPIYKGTVNDPTDFPTPSRMHGSHHWSFERLLSASLIPLTGAAFATSPSVHPVLDGLLGVSLIVHSHMGFDAMLVDYLHPRKFPVLGHVATWTLRSATVGVLVGVYQFNTNDIGLTELITKVWSA